LSSEILATAVSQYRNAYVNALLNKADPYLAAHFAKLILAGLPPEAEEDLNDPAVEKEPQPPEKFTNWMEDPDGNLYQGIAFKYCKELMTFAEHKQAKAVYDTLSRYRS
jgi:hypothetical protein